MLQPLQSLAIQVLACTAILAPCHSLLQEKFTRCALLKPDMIQVREKRDVHTGKLASKTLVFSVLAKKFVLNLNQGSSVIHRDFQATTVGADGAETPFFVDRENFYAGFVHEEPTSWVDIAYMDGIWVGRVFTSDEIYSIEPLRHHYPAGRSDLMVVFSNRDVKVNASEASSPFCQEVHFQEEEPLKPGNAKSGNGRTKRQIDKNIFSQRSKKLSIKRRAMGRDRTTGGEWPKLARTKRRPTHDLPNVCEMLAIADYQAYMGVGEGSVRRTVGILLNVYQTADRIFNSTKFGDLVPQRVKVMSFVVHTTYTESTVEHYNKEFSQLDGRQTIELLTTFSYFKNFCLMHLTTQKQFGETLGLAATAENSGTRWANGICAGYGTSARNVGLSTTLRVGGQPMPLSNYALVVAHELGHNFGSSHDPDNPTCSPPTRLGGKYLMWPRAGLGLDPNSIKFSPCSLQIITETLSELYRDLKASFNLWGMEEKKSHRCFKRESQTNQVCGDGQIDYPEDCDVGYRELDDDTCCSLECRFRDTAVCSPFNHPCCTDDCRVAPNTVKCRDDVIVPCHVPSFCTGEVHAYCSPPMPLPNNSTCGDHGKCWYGRCLDFCEVKGLSFDPPRQLLPCTCDQSAATMCYHCCKDAMIEGSCKNMGVKIADGLSCLLGYCKGGVCVRAVNNDLSANIQSLKASLHNGNQVMNSFLLIILIEFMSLCVALIF